MITDVGEYIVGAYLQLYLKCDVVSYNVRPPGGGMDGLAEFDVIGLNHSRRLAYVCEVTTHIRGLLYGKNTAETIKKLTEKHQRQRQYAVKYLCDFKCVYLLCSPVVPVGKITRGLANMPTLVPVINKKYSKRIRKLQVMARKSEHDTRNPFFRMLQILEHLRT